MDFEDYVAARGRRLLSFAYVLTGNVHAAEDLTQTALAKAYRRWGRVIRADHPDRYVRQVILNTYLSWRRRRSFRESPIGLAADDGDAAWVADHADAAVTRDAVWRAVRALPPRARAIVVLKYFEDADDSTIAAALGISRSTVSATNSRALTQLRQRLADGSLQPGRSEATPQKRGAGLHERR